MTRHAPSFRTIGLMVLSLVFVLLWSSGWTASALVISDSSALSVLSARYMIVAVVLVLLITILRQWRIMQLGEIRHHLLIGALCHALYLLFGMSAFEWGVSATVVSFINSLQPMATVALATPTIGTQMQSRHLKGLVLGIVSVALIISNSYPAGTPSFALGLPFIAMMSMTLGTVLHSRREVIIARSAVRRSPLLLGLLVQVTGALIVFLPAAAVTNNLQWNFTASEWTMILWLAFAVSLGAYAAFLLLLRYLSAIRASSLTYLVPPVTMLQMYCLFEESLSLSSMLALCVASVAVYMIISPIRVTRAVSTRSGFSARLARQRLNKLSRRTAGIDIELV